DRAAYQLRKPPGPGASPPPDDWVERIGDELGEAGLARDFVRSLACPDRWDRESIASVTKLLDDGVRLSLRSAPRRQPATFSRNRPVVRRGEDQEPVPADDLPLPMPITVAPRADESPASLEPSWQNIRSAPDGPGSAPVDEPRAAGTSGALEAGL